MKLDPSISISKALFGLNQRLDTLLRGLVYVQDEPCKACNEIQSPTSTFLGIYTDQDTVYSSGNTTNDM